MPTIKIKTDKLAPDYCALEAVSLWMLANYHERDHRQEREITVKSGRTLKVKELAQKKGASICSCEFKVTTVIQGRGNG